MDRAAPWPEVSAEDRVQDVQHCGSFSCSLDNFVFLKFLVFNASSVSGVEQFELLSLMIYGARICNTCVI